MATWNTLREFLESHVLPEEKMYRGETNVTLKDVEKLFDALRGGGEKPASTADPQVLSGQPPNPEGGAVSVNYEANPRVWGRWARTPNLAAIFSTTKDDQAPGVPQGGTVMKKTHGGGITYSPGRSRNDFERLPSAMDRYDIIMVGDVEGAAISTKGVSSGAGKIAVQRIAWSPAIGSTEERQKRLMDLLNGGQGSVLRRRPQPHRPEPSKQDADDAMNRRSPDVPRQGHSDRLSMGGHAKKGD